MTPESKETVTKKQLFLRCCYLCKKNRITVNKLEEKSINISTNKAQESLKKAAVLKNDYIMLGTIKDVDLIGAQFKKHRKCYREYNRISSETSNREEIKES